MHPTEILQLRETKIIHYFFKSFCCSKITGSLQTCTHIYISVPSCTSAQIQSKTTCTWALARSSCSAWCPWQTHTASSTHAPGASCQSPLESTQTSVCAGVQLSCFKLKNTALVQKNTSKEVFKHIFSIKILWTIPYMDNTIYIYIYMCYVLCLTNLSTLFAQQHNTNNSLRILPCPQSL